MLISHLPISSINCYSSSLDQLNTTVHGTMNTTPFELVFGQPPRQAIFPGASGTHNMEEDAKDLIDEADYHSSSNTSATG